MEDADRVLERLAGEDVRRLEVALDELDDLPARRSARWRRRESTAGIAAPPGSVSPSASVTQAIVEAVPIVMQWPFDRDIEFSISTHSASRDPAGAELLVVVPAVRAGAELAPRQCPFSIGPPVTTIAGMSALAAPMMLAGFVLSQPVSRTTPSSG